MKINVILFVALVASKSAEAQSILSCEYMRPDTTVQARWLLQNLKYKRDTLWYRNAPLQVCSSEGGFALNFGCSDYYNQAGFDVYYDDFVGASPFNNRIKGLKTGIWFTHTLFGSVKTATYYIEGRVRFIMAFWPNGRPQSIHAFKASGKSVGERVIGGSVYYKRR